MTKQAQSSPDDASARLRINEIFYSLQGEASTVGWPTVFVRLTGCPLRCNYCDTEYAFHEGHWMNVGAVLTEIGQYDARYVTVTGGEPLAQKSSRLLLRELCDRGYHVSLETSGALDIADIDVRVTKVMDLKTPASGEVGRNLYDNLNHLAATDQIKFVLCDRQDYEWARQLMLERKLTDRFEVLFSPSSGQLDARDLADWILEDRLPVRFQIQLHKYLWGDERGR